MKGSIRSAGDGVWYLRVDVGRDENGKRQQRRVTFKGTKKEAQGKLRELCSAAEGDTFIEPKKVTLGDWLKDWIAGQKDVATLRASTLRRYRDVIDDVRVNAVASIPLQKLRESHLERYYATVTEGSRHIHHTVLRRALRRAVKERLMPSNPAADMDHAPRRARQRLSEFAEVNCWSADEARRFLAVVKQADPQTAALFAFLLDTGARKNEACALRWSDVDLDGGIVTIERQLMRSPGKDGDGRREPLFGPTKTGQTRTTALNPETVRLLKAHRQHQAELKLKNRTVYRDFGLVFAKEWGESWSRKDLLGEPLQSNNLGERMLDPLIKKAGVKRITTHGLRHTAGTLMLLAGIPVHVVAARLGHADTSTTLSVYAHALRDAHEDAAAKLGKVLHGGGG